MPRFYTVALREKGKTSPFSYIGEDLKVYDTSKHCKPLTRSDAHDAKQRLIDGAAKAGRPIECRVVILHAKG